MELRKLRVIDGAGVAGAKHRVLFD